MVARVRRRRSGLPRLGPRPLRTNTQAGAILHKDDMATLRRILDIARVAHRPGYLEKIGSPDGAISKSFAERMGLEIDN